MALVAFCGLMFILTQGHDAGASSIKYPAVAVMKWVCTLKYSSYNYYDNYRMCNKTYTLVQRTSKAWSMLGQDGSLKDPDYLCHSSYKHFHVILDHIQQSTIPQGFFLKFPCVNELDISSQMITHINRDDFIGADNLLTLNVSHNRISNIPSRTFEIASNLTTIDLSHNSITQIDPNAFDDLTQLKQLYLDNNFILSISTRFFNPELTLTLAYNALEEIQSHTSSGQFPSIQYLSAAFNPNLTIVPHLNASVLSVGYTSIRTVSFSPITIILEAVHCGIESVEIPPTNVLKGLFIANNRLISIENFTALTSLVFLDVSHNYIETIDNSFLSHFPLLKALNVSNNKLITFDQNVSPHPIVLENLNVGHNYLTSFKLKQNFNHLKILKIDSNNLTSIDSNIREMAPLLESLDLNGNNFTCSHLTMSLLLLKYDGITLEASTTSIAQTEDWEYVKGIRCWNPKTESSKTIDVKATDTRMLDTDFENTIKESVLRSVNEAIGRMEMNFENKLKMLKKNLAELIPSGNTIQPNKMLRRSI